MRLRPFPFLVADKESLAGDQDLIAFEPAGRDRRRPGSCAFTKVPPDPATPIAPSGEPHGLAYAHPRFAPPVDKEPRRVNLANGKLVEDDEYGPDDRLLSI
ncbi:hypothetical protein [Microtetraspora glauca]|uniref:ATP-grasp-modified RiPP n=1 Tax=Microtetraspora glauca TaxID=1996 RepID=A0ABV3GAH2_MICGL